MERQRSILARTFEHGKMKGICEEILKVFKSGGDLRTVVSVLTLASDAFAAWRAIRTQDAAQDFLLQLFLPKSSRQ